MTLRNIRGFLSLDRRVIGLFMAIFMITLGEELWVKFIPNYFIALGGTAFALGVFKSFSDALDALAQLPGGIISDKIGRVTAAITFLLLGIFGYLVFFLAPSWQYLFLGAFLMQGTSSYLQPTVFSIIGDSLPPEKRTMAFSVQSILKRVPIILAPLIGGYFIAKYGIIPGVKLSVVITIFFVIIGIFIIKFSGKNVPPTSLEQAQESTSTSDSSKTMTQRNTVSKERQHMFNANFAFLLTADILARFGQAMVKYFIIIYVTMLVGAQKLGFLISLQMIVAILSYIPAVWVANRIGRKPVIALTFTCFALYPFVTLYATSFEFLLLAFFIAGFREFGEPARKALIVNLSKQSQRGKNVGLYYTIRSLSIVPAGILGGLLWLQSPILTGLVASSISALGLLVFVLFVQDTVVE